MYKHASRLSILWLGLLLLSGEDTRAQSLWSAVPLRCQDMISTQGVFRFTQRTTPRNPEVCLTMLRAPVNKKIEVQIRTGNVSCENPGEIAFIDGLNLQDDYFPGESDSGVPASDRLTVLCDTSRPSRFVANQNVATILFRFPEAGRRFTMRVRHLPNPEPCNVVAPHPNATGLLKLQNFGRKSNCSYLILYPTEFTVLDAKLGGVSGYQCSKGGDFFEIRSGSNIDPLKSTAPVANSCQMATAKRFSTEFGPMLAASPCYASVVRLVSSGLANNLVVVKHKPMDLEEADRRCPMQ